MKREKTPQYSIVVPIHNEEESIIPLFAKIVEMMEAQDGDFEIVFVDDASADDSPVLLEQIATLDSRVLVVQLRRPFGQSVALAAGFDYARGEITISLDSNFLHEPADLLLLIEKIHQGYDLVSGWRKQRADRFSLRRFPAAIANWAMRVLSGIPLHDFGMTFKACRRETIRNVNSYGELHRFLPALAGLQGARLTEIPLQGVAGNAKRSPERWNRTFRAFVDLLTARFLLRHFIRPLRFFGTLSLTCFAVAFGTVAYLVYEKLEGHTIFPEHGLLSVIAGVAVLAGIQFLSTGLMGELVTRVHSQGEQRRLYSVSRVISRSRKAGIV
ncbi:MAG: glycosyltransferase family 2 protein [Acidobacteria bacterium]|nr:glycosyltransferase family 2 protein [Acidobacteriota bacterium]